MQYRCTCLLIVAINLLLMQCHKDNTITSEIDTALFAKAQSLNGFTYYKGTDSIYASSPQSAHKAFFRVRFNATAQAALTDNGKLPAGASFPEGSLIVKELHNDSLGTQLAGYAVMEKLATDTNQQHGWVWAEYKLNGTGYTLSQKGGICTSCHSTNSRDDVRLFNLFP